MPSTATDTDGATKLLAWAQSQLGKPYKYGAVGPGSFDCSGLTQAAAAAGGLKLPRTSSEQYSATQRVTFDQLQPGDLVFSEWAGDDVPHHGHVAIYAGNGQIIEAPHTGAFVQKVPLDQNYLAHVDGYGRVATSDSTLPGGANASPAGNVTASPAGFSFGDILTAPFQSLNQAGNFLGQIYDVLAAIFSFFAAFFRPSTYIRIGAGIAGIAFVITGIVFLAREAKA